MMKRATRLWLCLPPLAACWLDVSATLLGQGPRYWAGDYTHVTEWNRLARELLRLHPPAFVSAAAASCALVAAAVLLLNRRLAVVVAFVVTFGHIVAAASWATRTGLPGMVVAVVMLVAAGRLVELSWRKS